MSVLSTVRKQPAWNIAENLGRFLVECTGQGNNFELIQLVRMKTRNPVGDHLVVNFWRSVIIAKFLEKWHLMVKFSKFCSKSFHCDTDRRAVFKFREIWTTRSQWNRACLLDKNNKSSPGSPAVATARIAPKICRGQPPTMYSQCSRFHPNHFTFGGVIAEHVNTAKMRRKVNPIFNWSRASSRIIILNSSLLRNPVQYTSN